MLGNLSRLIAIVAVSAVSNVWFLMALLPLLCMLYYTQRVRENDLLKPCCSCVTASCAWLQYYRASSRQLRRLEGATRSPIVSLVEETMKGVTNLMLKRRFNALLLFPVAGLQTIRAFHMEDVGMRNISAVLTIQSSLKSDVLLPPEATTRCQWQLFSSRVDASAVVGESALVQSGSLAHSFSSLLFRHSVCACLHVRAVWRLHLRLSFLAALAVFSTSLMFVFLNAMQPETIDPALAGCAQQRELIADSRVSSSASLSGSLLQAGPVLHFAGGIFPHGARALYR